MGFNGFTPKSFRFLGQTFQFCDAKKAVRIVGKKRIARYMDRRIAKMTLEDPYQTYIAMKSRGDDMAQAWNRLSRAFDAFLGYSNSLSDTAIRFSTSVSKLASQNLIFRLHVGSLMQLPDTTCCFSGFLSKGNIQRNLPSH